MCRYILVLSKLGILILQVELIIKTLVLVKVLFLLTISKAR